MAIEIINTDKFQEVLKDIEKLFTKHDLNSIDMEYVIHQLHVMTNQVLNDSAERAITSVRMKKNGLN